MKPVFKIQRTMLARIHADLSRRHAFAAERVGFISCKVAALPDNGLAVLAHDYHPVHDDHYEDDPSVGAMLNAAAFREVLQYSFRNRAAIFHVHRHEHHGRPRFSHVDVSESRKFVPDFWKVQRALPHGVLVLSHDQMHGLCWLPESRATTPFEKYIIVGLPTTSIAEVKNGQGYQ